jgi:hypothetical protein
MLRDVESFTSRMSKIDGSGDVGAHLSKLVKDKKIVKPIPPLPQPQTPAVETSEKIEEVVANGDEEIDKVSEVAIPGTPLEKAEEILLKEDGPDTKKEDS